MFQFIVLLFYNIVIMPVADLLIMFCFCNKYFLLMNICLIFVLYIIYKSYRAESFTKYMCMYIFCPTNTDLFLNLALFPY